MWEDDYVKLERAWGFIEPRNLPGHRYEPVQIDFFRMGEDIRQQNEQVAAERRRQEQIARYKRQQQEIMDKYYHYMYNNVSPMWGEILNRRKPVTKEQLKEMV